MATVATTAGPALDSSTGMFAPQIPDLLAGEAIAAGASCYIKAADGKAYNTNATAAGTEATRLAGFSPRAAAAGQPVTLFGVGARFRYSSGLTPGAILFMSATTPGALDTAATTGDAVGVAQCVTDTDIRVTRAV
jgi:hypothetical protein